MNKKAFVLISLMVTCSFIAVSCAPMKSRPPAKPSPSLPTPWPTPPSSGPPSETLDRDKNFSRGGNALTRQKRSQEENNKKCQNYYNSTDYFFEPVQRACLSCRVCVDSADSYCEVCIKPTTTVPSSVDTPSTPEDSSDSLLDTTTDVQQTSEMDQNITAVVPSTSSGTPGWSWILLIVILVMLCVLVSICLLVWFIKRYKRVAEKPPAVMAQAPPTTPEEEETCLNGINNDNIETGLTKSYQDTEPVPPCHPMGPNSLSSSLASSNGSSMTAV